METEVHPGVHKPGQMVLLLLYYYYYPEVGLLHSLRQRRSLEKLLVLGWKEQLPTLLFGHTAGAQGFGQTL